MVLEYRDVFFSYPGSDPVLKGISFSVDEGERVGIVGSNGAGKSTLLKTAVGLLEVQGSITVCGTELNGGDIAAVRKCAGFVLQDPDSQMFMPKVIDDMVFGPVNYGMARADAEAKADEILAGLGISYLRDRYNHRISGGEKRMAAIATVLMMEPEVILMDEPSSSLDPRNRRSLINTVNSLNGTMLIASHDLDMVLDTCGRVILLDSGTVVKDAPAQEILTDRELLEAHGLELPLSLYRR